MRLTRRSGALFTVVSYLSEKRVDFLHHSERARDAVGEFFEVLLLKFGALGVVPMRPRFLPCQEELLGRLVEGCCAAFGAHGVWEGEGASV